MQLLDVTVLRIKRNNFISIHSFIVLKICEYQLHQMVYKIITIAIFKKISNNNYY